jgi:hypothetical protein
MSDTGGGGCWEDESPDDEPEAMFAEGPLVFPPPEVGVSKSDFDLCSGVVWV